MRQNELEYLQYGRAIAALMVVFAHGHEQIAGLQRFMNTSIGEGGVDLFFVISGFVMVYTTDGRKMGAGEFMARRIARIVPIYWIMTALTAVLLIVAGDIARDSRFTLPSLLLSMVFWPHVNPGDGQSLSPMLKLGWTLNYEMFFYAVFAALLWLRTGWRLVVMALLFAALCALGAEIAGAPPPLRVWSGAIIFEFLLGAAIAWVTLRRSPLPVGASLGLGGLGLVLMVGLADLDMHRLFARGVPAALIIAALVQLERARGPEFRNAVLKRLGDASYSLYLAHLYPVILCRVLWERFAPLSESPVAAFLFVLVCYVAGVAAGLLLHAVVERPITRWLSKRLNRWFRRADAPPVSVRVADDPVAP